MPRTNFQELLDAGVHFGHLARKWNPKMAPYIFDQKNGIHIIDLHKSIVKIDEAANVMKQLARSGRKILFVATKKQAKEIVAEKAAAVNMPEGKTREEPRLHKGSEPSSFSTFRSGRTERDECRQRGKPSQHTGYRYG